jgi:hypothetical protein
MSWDRLKIVNGRGGSFLVRERAERAFGPSVAVAEGHAEAGLGAPNVANPEAVNPGRRSRLLLAEAVIIPDRYIYSWSKAWVKI